LVLVVSAGIRRGANSCTLWVCFEAVSVYKGWMTLGFIGCGKMASALVRGIVKAGVCAPSQIFVSDVVEFSAKALEEELQVRALKANADLVAAADTLVLCVKPQDALLALNELQSKLNGKLVVSIAAGLTLAQLESATGSNARVVRVMPNTPALVNCGASAYATGSRATDTDAQVVEKLFAAVGFVGRVKESLLDAVTGLSGSGPAYGYVLVEALADGGVLMGLPRDLSLKLAAQTLNDILEEGGQAELLVALRQMAKAFGGLSNVAKQAELNPPPALRGPGAPLLLAKCGAPFPSDP
jgi:pyrroline-5-carboxylate reductase